MKQEEKEKQKNQTWTRKDGFKKFPNLGIINVLGWIILHFGGLGAALAYAHYISLALPQLWQPKMALAMYPGGRRTKSGLLKTAGSEKDKEDR